MPDHEDAERIRQALLNGERLAFDAALPAEARTIDAVWIEAAVLAKSAVDVENAIVTGPLTLKYADVQGEFSLVQCKLERCDFSHATFRRVAVFRGCRFIAGVDFTSASFDDDCDVGSAEIDSPPAAFQDIRVRGTFSAECIRVAEGVEADFTRARLERTAYFLNAEFGGEFSFRLVVLGDQGAFQGARFRGPAHFRACRFGHHALFRAEPGQAPAAVFETDVHFDGAHIGGQALFQGVRFKQKASFNGCRVVEGAFFESDSPQDEAKGRLTAITRFEGDADFIGLHVERNAYFGGAIFARAATFDFANMRRVEFTLRKGGRIYGARFRRALSCQQARLGGAEFRAVAFRAIADFSQTIIDGPATFTSGCRFSGEARFRRVQVFGQADFRSATFRRKADFDLARLGGETFFRPDDAGLPTRFEGEAVFAMARFGGLADFTGAQFAGDANFYAADADSIARFAEAGFDAHAVFRGASFRSVDFSDTDFRHDVDLRDLTYGRIQGGWRELLQRASPYDRQPYTQLETVLRAIGQDREADKAYLLRQTAERRERWRKRDYVGWMLSGLYFVFLRYGVRPYQLFAFGGAIFVAGALFFQLPGSVSPKERGLGAVAAAQIRLSPLEAAGMSLRQFLPFEVPVAASWVPSDQPIPAPFSHVSGARQYMVTPSWVATLGLRVPGWLLLPLLIAGFSGIARRQP